MAFGNLVSDWNWIRRSAIDQNSYEFLKTASCSKSSSSKDVTSRNRASRQHCDVGSTISCDRRRTKYSPQFSTVVTIFVILIPACCSGFGSRLHGSTEGCRRSFLAKKQSDTAITTCLSVTPTKSDIFKPAVVSFVSLASAVLLEDVAVVEKVRNEEAEQQSSKGTKSSAGRPVDSAAAKLNRKSRAIGKLSSSVIHNTIEDILNTNSSSSSSSTTKTAPVQEQRLTNNNKNKSDTYRSSAAFAVCDRTVGILGDPVEDKGELQDTRNNTKNVNKFQPGAVILGPSTSAGLGDVTVRVSTPMDDLDIANLRMSVFSDFSPEMQSQFCARSCRAIAIRRRRGATCLIATAVRCSDNDDCLKGSSRQEIILGSAECSFHEFFGTRLGERRPARSILYATEVAVNPAVRRQGIGSKLLAAMDKLAYERNAETLYLHVDVKNEAAIALYVNAGYQKVISDPIFLEFTTSLNLHPGATKGRDHFLFYKDLTPQPTWLAPPPPRSCHPSEYRQPERLVGTLGIEIPA